MSKEHRSRHPRPSEQRYHALAKRLVRDWAEERQRHDIDTIRSMYTEIDEATPVARSRDEIATCQPLMPAPLDARDRRNQMRFIFRVMATLRDTYPAAYLAAEVWALHGSSREGAKAYKQGFNTYRVRYSAVLAIVAYEIHKAHRSA